MNKGMLGALILAVALVTIVLMGFGFLQDSDTHMHECLDRGGSYTPYLNIMSCTIPHNDTYEISCFSVVTTTFEITNWNCDYVKLPTTFDIGVVNKDGK